MKVKDSSLGPLLPSVLFFFVLPTNLLWRSVCSRIFLKQINRKKSFGEEGKKKMGERIGGGEVEKIRLKRGGTDTLLRKRCFSYHVNQ